MQKEKIGIIGGKGLYGSFWVRFFESRGYMVKSSDRGTAMSNEDVVRWADVVIIAVTLLETVKTIVALLPLLRDDQLLVDIASTKSNTVAHMLNTDSEVVGLHPFCAPPKRDTFKGQTIFVHYSRLGRWKEWVKEFLSMTEAKIVEVSPDEHDKARTVDQVCEHMCSMIKTTVMRRLGLDPSTIFEYASPVYKMTAAQMARMYIQSPELYGGLAMSNPYTMATLRMFEEAFKDYCALIGGKDIDVYSSWFRRNREYLGGKFVESAFELSEHLNGLMIDLMSENSLRMSFENDCPGLLMKVSSFFSEAGINLTVTHCRKVAGKAEFFIAFEGNHDPCVVAGIRERLINEIGAEIV